MGVQATYQLETMEYDEDSANRILHSFIHAIEDGAGVKSKHT
jgi:hypothetical protein